MTANENIRPVWVTIRHIEKLNSLYEDLYDADNPIEFFEAMKFWMMKMVYGEFSVLEYHQVASLAVPIDVYRSYIAWGQAQ